MYIIILIIYHIPIILNNIIIDKKLLMCYYTVKVFTFGGIILQDLNTNHTRYKKGRHTHFLFLASVPVSFIILAFLLDTPKNIFPGLYRIILAPDNLLTDYLEVGGFGATLLNVSLISLMNIFILYKLELKLSGTVIAAVFTSIGFSFFGKTIFNILPMYLGGILYAKYNKIPFKNVITTIMFSTCLAPVVSQLTFSSGMPIYAGLVWGILFGIIAGFLITPLSKNMYRLHDGHNLYNVGFTAGIIGIFANSIMKSFGINIEQQLILSNEYDSFFKLYLLIIFILFIALGYIINGKSFKGYGKITSSSGKLPTDYVELTGYGLTLINMGTMGLICMSFVFLTSGVYNGPIIGGILTVAGFAAIGNHPGNSIPIMIGVFIGGIFKVWDIQSTPVIISGIFGTTLAPIAGTYGFYAGILAGFIHLSVTMNVGVVHGGTNLYNNGFAGGLVASVLFTLFESLKNKSK